MAYVKTSSNDTIILCLRCGQEVKVDTSQWLSSENNIWHAYTCQHCGYNDVINHKFLLQEEIALNRIEDRLDKIEELLEKVINNGLQIDNTDCVLSYGNNHIDTSEMWTDQAYRTIEFTSRFELFDDKNDSKGVVK